MIEIFTAIGSIAAAGALVVSIVSLVKSSKVEKLQKEVSELDSRLKQYELENIEKNREACVEARLVKDGKSHYLKIFNKERLTMKILQSRFCRLRITCTCRNPITKVKAVFILTRNHISQHKSTS